MTESIAPRSDQMNADDLMSGPRTFTIREVRKSSSSDQPIDVHLVEFPEGRPFKPSKSMRRVMVAAWGPDASTYTGRRMTLYRDPTVRFGGQEVGGIRISHLDGIDKPMTLALTVTRGKRSPYVVQPIPKAEAAKLPTDRIGKMIAAFAAQNVDLDRLEAKVGKPRAEWTDQDVTAAAVWYKAITAEGADVDELFPDPDVTVPEQTTLPDDWVDEPPVAEPPAEAKPEKRAPRKQQATSPDEDPTSDTYVEEPPADWQSEPVA